VVGVDSKVDSGSKIGLDIGFGSPSSWDEAELIDEELPLGAFEEIHDGRVILESMECAAGRSSSSS